MIIIWRPVAGDRAIAPYLDGERMPFTVCKIGPVGGVQVYEAWKRPNDKFKYAEMLACNLATAREAKAMIERLILAEAAQ